MEENSLNQRWKEFLAKSSYAARFPKKGCVTKINKLDTDNLAELFNLYTEARDRKEKGDTSCMNIFLRVAYSMARYIPYVTKKGSKLLKDTVNDCYDRVRANAGYFVAIKGSENTALPVEVFYEQQAFNRFNIQ